MLAIPGTSWNPCRTPAEWAEQSRPGRHLALPVGTGTDLRIVYVPRPRPVLVKNSLRADYAAGLFDPVAGGQVSLGSIRTDEAGPGGARARQKHDWVLVLERKGEPRERWQLGPIVQPKELGMLRRSWLSTAMVILVVTAGTAQADKEATRAKTANYRRGQVLYGSNCLALQGFLCLRQWGFRRKCESPANTPPMA